MCCGEGEFPINRILQIAQSFEKRSGIRKETLLNEVHIEKFYDIEQVSMTLVINNTICFFLMLFL
jgi:hypothetical protein